jgi:hypothetical protein
MVEPAFLVLSRRADTTTPVPDIQIVLADRWNEDRAIRDLRKEAGTASTARHDGWSVFRASRETFTAASWMPRSQRAVALIEKLSKSGIAKIGDLFDVKLGIRTGANDVFLLTEDALRQLGASQSELQLFRPVAGNDTIQSGVIRRGEYVFYPYNESRRPLFETDAELALAAPTYYSQVLLPKQNSLSSRKSLRRRLWWELVEPRTTWQAVARPKLISSCFGGGGKFAYDADGRYSVLQGFGWLWRRGGFSTDDIPFAYRNRSPEFQAISKAEGNRLDSLLVWKS